MLKQMLLIGAAAISFPALAQATVPAPSAAPPTTAEPAPAPDASTPPASSQPAPSGAGATPSQIAQIVEQEFPTYDGDKNGDLNAAEFGAWMKKLRVATDPSVDPESADVKSWIGQAFASADGDKSGAVNKAELTGFLSRGA